MINLPQDTDQLRDTIKAAIQFYQESPVNNEDKLNEALAYSLGFKNFEQLSAQLKDSNPINTYEIEFDSNGDQTLIINGVRIDADLAHEEIVAYTVSDREDRISDLRQWIAEAQNDPRRAHEVPTMQNDLDTLLSSSAEWVLDAIGTNEFIAADLEPELFNKACDEMLAQAAEYYREKVGQLTKTGKRIDNAQAYFSGEPVATVWANELVLIKEAYLSDDKLPFGMTVRKFEGEVPEGYIAAYAGAFDEYVPIEFDEG